MGCQPPRRFLDGADAWRRYSIFGDETGWLPKEASLLSSYLFFSCVTRTCFGTLLRAAHGSLLVVTTMGCLCVLSRTLGMLVLHLCPLHELLRCQNLLHLLGRRGAYGFHLFAQLLHLFNLLKVHFVNLLDLVIVELHPLRHTLCTVLRHLLNGRRSWAYGTLRLFLCEKWSGCHQAKGCCSR